MASGNIRVLIINRQLGFSVRIKQALEQVGGFEVAPFTSADAALEYLQGHPQDVSLVDFTIPGVSGSDLVYMMRQIQPDLPVIVSPDLPNIVAEARNLNINGIVDVPISARELKPILERVVQEFDEPMTDTAEATAAFQEDETTDMESSGTASEFASLDSGVIVRTRGLLNHVRGETDDADDGEGEQELEAVEFVLKDEISAFREQFDQDEVQDEEAERAVDVFQKLAEEEPPMPTLEDSGTVSDLKTGVTSANLYELAESIVEERSRPMEPLDQDTLEAESGDSTPVKLILESTYQDDSDKPSLDDLLANIERQFPEDVSGVRPLPSWVKDVERYVKEPDFLGSALPEIEDQPESATTFAIDEEDLPVAVEPEIGLDASSVPSDVSEDAYSTGDFVAADEEEAADVSGFDEVYKADPSETYDEFEQWLDADDIAEITPALSAPDKDDLADISAEMPVKRAQAPQATLEDVVDLEESDSEELIEQRRGATGDPELAQMALSLTQASLESTAVAILLAKGEDVVAYSGDLPLEEMAKLHQTLAGDWDANPGEARVRFATLADTGIDYMLYSRRTEGNFTLSLIFEGTLPLRVIRQQSDKIIDALSQIPEDNGEIVVQESAVIDELYELEEVAAQEEELAIESTQELLRQQGGKPEEVPEATEITVAPVKQAEPVTTSTYLWMLRDSSMTLSRKAAQVLVLRLDEWLSSIGWHVEVLQVYEDYIYLMADVPESETVPDVITELKAFSAKIVAQFDEVPDVNKLWADSYGYLIPGRHLTQDEIQEFINFERM